MTAGAVLGLERRNAYDRWVSTCSTWVYIMRISPDSYVSSSNVHDHSRFFIFERQAHTYPDPQGTHSPMDPHLVPLPPSPSNSSSGSVISASAKLLLPLLVTWTPDIVKWYIGAHIIESIRSQQAPDKLIVGESTYQEHQ